MTEFADLAAQLPHKLTLTPLLATVLVVGFVVYSAFNNGHRTKDMPTGPSTLPFIGNLHQIPAAYTHVKFKEWAKQYGSLFTLKLGTGTMAVISDRRLIKEVIDKKSGIYSQRPPSYVSHDLITKGNHLLVMYYGNQWRSFRKHIHQHFYEGIVEREHLPLQNAEAVQLVHDFLVDPSNHMLHPKRYSNSITNSLVFGIRTPSLGSTYMRRLYDLMENWSAIMETGATPPVDIFPWMKLLPQRLFGNYVTRAKSIGAQMEGLYEDVLSRVEKRRQAGINAGSFLDKVLDSGELPRDHKRFIGGVLMEGGSDTSSSLTIAIVQALVKFPEVQKKAQAQIDAIVGEGRSPTWADFKDLSYINQIVKEGHRWRPILPLGFPHALAEDDWIEGKFLPKGTIVIMNVWAMHMDPSVWDRPEEFIPERYESRKELLSPEYIASGDWEKRDHFGYGAGRRVCPGMHLAERNMFLAIAKLIWAFRFEEDPEKPNNPDPVDGYHQGFLYCAKDYGCKVTVRSPAIRDAILREYAQAQTDIFSNYET